MSGESAPPKPTPLFALHQAMGGRLVPFAGYALPVQYADGILAEHRWTREQAGLFDVSHMGQVTVTGPDADTALERVLPGDIRDLRLNRLRYSLLLDSAGGILDDLMVTRRADDLLLVVNGAFKAADTAHLRAALEPGCAVSLHDDQALLALQGPRAVDALVRLAPGAADLVFMQAAGLRVAGIETWISRSGYTGEDGFEISVAADRAVELAKALLDQPEVRPIGLGARDSLRLEAGLPLSGHDISPTTDPVSAGLAFAVSKRRKVEGGFPGADRVLNLLLDGPPRRRVGLVLDGRQPAREGCAILAGDAIVGTVTSGGFAPTLNAPIAMGYVDAAHAGDGTALAIDVRGKALPARVTPMPFVPHRYVRSTARKESA